MVWHAPCAPRTFRIVKCTCDCAVFSTSHDRTSIQLTSNACTHMYSGCRPSAKLVLHLDCLCESPLLLLQSGPKLFEAPPYVLCLIVLPTYVVQALCRRIVKLPIHILILAYNTSVQSDYYVGLFFEKELTPLLKFFRRPMSVTSTTTSCRFSFTWMQSHLSLPQPCFAGCFSNRNCLIDSYWVFHVIAHIPQPWFGKTTWFIAFFTTQLALIALCFTIAV